MDELELFTVDVFQSKPNGQGAEDKEKSTQTKSIEIYRNMTAARIIKGRILELEHSNLVGPAVKFKTVVNYERTLEPGTLLGLSFTAQDGYLS